MIKTYKIHYSLDKVEPNRGVPHDLKNTIKGASGHIGFKVHNAFLGALRWFFGLGVYRFKNINTDEIFYVNKESLGHWIAANPGVLDPKTFEVIQISRIVQDVKRESLPKALPLILEPSGIDKDKLGAVYQMLKNKLSHAKYVHVEFDDQNKRVTFYHSEHEIEVIMRAHKIKLTDVINQSLSLMEDPLLLTHKGAAPFTLGFECREIFLEKEKQLIEKAEQFFKKDTAFKDVEVSDQLKLPNLTKDLLSQHDGIVIGETHDDAAPKKFIMDNLQNWKKQGVTTLFLEHIFHDSMQEMLDDYFKAPKDTPMPEQLSLYLKYLSSGQRNFHKEYNFEKLVKAAKEAGIRVVAIDTTVSYLSGTDRNFGVVKDTLRYKAMNYTAADIIAKEKKGKFVALMGSAHIGTCKGVRGVAEIVACPSLVIETAKDNQPSLELNVRNFYDEIAHIGGLLKLPV